MGDISPKVAAELANEIYLVRANESEGFRLFLKRPQFSAQNGTSKQLKAEVGSRLINTSDAFGICARGGTGYEKDLFLLFRGTTTANYCADVISDLRAGIETSRTGLPVHIGFNSIFCTMIADIKEFLHQNSDATGTIHVIGHSLGGAVAALAAEWLSARGKRVKVYTFGAPKPGLEFFASRLTTNVGNDNIYRVYHATDVVPMVPVYPFAHAPLSNCAYQLPSASLISISAHKMANYRKSVGSCDWETLKKTGIQTADERSVERWLKSDKPLNPANPETWDWINSGLMLVLRKIIGGAAIFYQARFVVGISLADKIAWILRKGIDLSVDASGWVLSLMRKILQALGMQIAKTAKELTQAFMRRVLQQLMQRMAAEAKRALRGLTQKP